jgi:uncharacterized protein
VLIAFWLCVAIFVIYAIAQSVANAPHAVPGQGRRRSDSGNWGGSWSSGGGGGGDSGGGGGWSGGGGDFGGGGSSGSW